MKKVITIGGAIIDLYIRSSEFKLQKRAEETFLCQIRGAKLEMDDCTLATGGGASNTAVGFSRLGFKTKIVSEIGHDYMSNIVLMDLRKDGVEVDLVIRERLEKTGTSVILVDNAGGRTVIVDRGASALLDGYDIPIAQMKDADWIHFTSVNGSAEVVAKVLKVIELNRTGFSWNPGKGELKLLATEEITLPNFSQPAVFFVNKEEWQMVEHRQTEIREKFSLVIVTDGENGGVVYDSRQALIAYQAGGTEHRIDDTGAGDAFGCGFIAALLHGYDLQMACNWGTKNAASVVQQIGAKPGLLTLNQISATAK